MLTDVRLRKLAPKESRYMVGDGKGLYIEVLTTGRKAWRLRMWNDGKEIKRSLGSYPAVTLAQARAKRDEIQTQLEIGEDPFEVKPDDTLEAKIHDVEHVLYPEVIGLIAEGSVAVDPSTNKVHIS